MLIELLPKNAMLEPVRAGQSHLRRPKTRESLAPLTSQTGMPVFYDMQGKENRRKDSHQCESVFISGSEKTEWFRLGTTNPLSGRPGA